MDQPIVLDIGTGLTKAGYAGQAEPICIFGSVVGVPKYQHITAFEGQEIDLSNSMVMRSGKSGLRDDIVCMSKGRRLLVCEKL